MEPKWYFNSFDGVDELRESYSLNNNAAVDTRRQESSGRKNQQMVVDHCTLNRSVGQRGCSIIDP